METKSTGVHGDARSMSGSRWSRFAKHGGIVLSGLLVAGTLLVTPERANATCASNTLKPGDTTVSISFGGRNRSYMLHVPASYTGTTPVPLVIDMHGFTSSANAQKGLSGYLQKSDKVGFIAAWPSGLSNSWNAYGCCGTSLRNNVNDVGFIRAVVADIVAKGVIDQSRVYATGLSNGGSMSHRLACEAADVFAATSPVSFTLNHPTAQCVPARPISVFHFHGLNDTTVPYNGGGSNNFQSAPASFSAWQTISHCNGTISTHTFTGNERCDTATTCSAGVTPTLCSLAGTHVLYNTQTTVAIAEYAWDNFLSKFTLPGGKSTCP